jgi:hypothetical protein
VGGRTEPCDTPACMYLDMEISSSTEILNFHCERNELISLINLVKNCNFDNLQSKPGCHVVSKAFSVSKNTASVDMLLLKFRVTWPAILIHCSVVL